MGIKAPIIDIIMEEVDGIPEPKIKVLEGDYEAVAFDTIRSLDGEIDITVHICELPQQNSDLLIVMNIVGSGIWCTGSISTITNAVHDINVLMQDLATKVNEAHTPIEELIMRD